MVPELKQGRCHGESEGANSACGFLSDARFAHAACHCFKSVPFQLRYCALYAKCREYKMCVEKLEMRCANIGGNATDCKTLRVCQHMYRTHTARIAPVISRGKSSQVIVGKPTWLCGSSSRRRYLKLSEASVPGQLEHQRTSQSKINSSPARIEAECHMPAVQRHI